MSGFTNIIKKFGWSKKPIVNSFWYGDSLSWIERACLKSFIRHGYHFRLYTYKPVNGVPEGVEVADANLVLREDQIFFYEGMNTEKSKGTPAIFSDHFRLKLQELECGLWVDCDIYCIRPFDITKRKNIYAFEKPYRISNAVLKLPKDSPILKNLLNLFQPPYEIPPWIPRHERDELKQRYGEQEIHPRLLHWASVGPKALSHLLHQYGRENLAYRPQSFFPVPVHSLNNLFDPNFRINDVITPNTRGIHLWNNEIRHRRNSMPPEGSFLHRLWLEGQE